MVFVPRRHVCRRVKSFPNVFNKWPGGSCTKTFCIRVIKFSKVLVTSSISGICAKTADCPPNKTFCRRLANQDVSITKTNGSLGYLWRQGFQCDRPPFQLISITKYNPIKKKDSVGDWQLTGNIYCAPCGSSSVDSAWFRWDVWLNTMEDIWDADVAICTTSFTDYFTTVNT